MRPSVRGGGVSPKGLLRLDLLHVPCSGGAGLVGRGGLAEVQEEAWAEANGASSARGGWMVNSQLHLPE